MSRRPQRNKKRCPISRVLSRSGRRAGLRPSKRPSPHSFTVANFKGAYVEVCTSARLFANAGSCATPQYRAMAGTLARLVCARLQRGIFYQCSVAENISLAEPFVGGGRRDTSRDWAEASIEQADRPSRQGCQRCVQWNCLASSRFRRAHFLRRAQAAQCRCCAASRAEGS